MNEWMNNDDDVKTMYNNDSPAHRLNFSYTIYWKMYMHTYIFFIIYKLKHIASTSCCFCFNLVKKKPNALINADRLCNSVVKEVHKQ